MNNNINVKIDLIIIHVKPHDKSKMTFNPGAAGWE